MNDPDSSQKPFGQNSVLLGGCGFELAIGGVALLLGWAFGPDPRATIPDIDQHAELGRDLLYGTLAAIPWLIGVALMDRLPWQWVEELRSPGVQIMSMLKSVSVPGLAVLAISAGVGEELLFRGWLQTALGGGPEQTEISVLVPAILGASLAFGLVHAVSRLYVVFALVMGIYLGWLFVFSGSLLVPIVTHSVYDFGAFLLLLRHSNTQPNDE